MKAADTAAAPVMSMKAADTGAAPANSMKAADTAAAPVMSMKAADAGAAPVNSMKAADAAAAPVMSMKAADTGAAPVNSMKAADAAAAPAMAMKAADTVAAPAMAMKAAAPPAEALPDLGAMPALAGATQWLNSPPLTTEALKGKVVLVDFWTYSCINCLREIPYIRAWAEKYRDQGLVVIGVHAPEFAFEKSIDNVRKAVADLKITYPVAIDNDYAIWRAFTNEYWPALYFVDAKGRLRHSHFGEGDYDVSERIIQQLLAEAGASAPSGLVAVNGAGAEAAADAKDMQSPETYLGYDRAANFASPGGAVPDAPHDYAVPANLALNGWGLSGKWTIGSDDAVLDDKAGALAFRFHARDVHMVLGPSSGGTPVRFRVKIDGATPGDNHGADIDASGEGVVTGQRLYQLVRQGDVAGADHTFEIEFLDPGVQAYTFTFG
jgi:thiol-disulfide isomerase/thioredoxin